VESADTAGRRIQDMPHRRWCRVDNRTAPRQWDGSPTVGRLPDSGTASRTPGQFTAVEAFPVYSREEGSCCMVSLRGPAQHGTGGMLPSPRKAIGCVQSPSERGGRAPGPPTPRLRIAQLSRPGRHGAPAQSASCVPFESEGRAAHGRPALR